MGSLRNIIFLGIAPALFAQPPAESGDRAETLAAIRETALKFDSSLPNFICTQVTRRHSRMEPEPVSGVKVSGSGRSNLAGLPGAGSGDWEPVDSIEEQLTYFGHKESYTVLKVNGKRVAKGQKPQPGLASTGEFGSTLNGIFDSASKAEFEWKREETLRGKRVNVFAFRIAQENSVAQLTAGTATIVAGYHGILYAELETNRILRVTTEAEVPHDFPLQKVTHLLDYGPVVIGGAEFFVPLHGRMESLISSDFFQYGRVGGNSRQLTLRNDVEFLSYRKYTADATLKTEQ